MYTFREESVWSSTKREASLQSAPNHVLPSSVQDVFDETVECYYNREYDDSPGGVLARSGGGDNGTTEIAVSGDMEEQAKSGGLYSGLIDLDNLMDKGANNCKSCPQSKQTATEGRSSATPIFFNCTTTTLL